MPMGIRACSPATNHVVREFIPREGVLACVTGSGGDSTTVWSTGGTGTDAAYSGVYGIRCVE
jgi:hypothetical protein